MFNALADGTAHIDGILESEDVRSTAACLRSLGVTIDWPHDGAAATVTGVGLRGLVEPGDVLDCGNSGTSMRLLSGILAGQPFLSVLTGDASLRSRNMSRITKPLGEMGASVSAREGGSLAPLCIRGGSLRGIDYRTPMASAQVKSAILLAGLFAEGETCVREPSQSRDHTERMLAAMGAPIVVDGPTVRIRAAAALEPLAVRVPRDISSAAAWLVLGTLHPDAELQLPGINVNETRTGLLDILTAMGGHIERTEERLIGGEHVADLVVRSAALHGVTARGPLVPRAIDELPLVALLGAFAEGETTVRDAHELVVKESNRVEAVARVLRAMGGEIETRDDGFTVRGRQALHGATVDAGHDHRIGMLAAVAGMLADGVTTVVDDAVGISYPGFWDDLRGAAEP
jgi:3-phosphoshikimate 1-carboxyvinyltransferase